MKNLNLFFIGLLLLPTLLLTSCDKGDDDPGTVQKPAFTLMKDYLVANNLDLPKVITNTDGVKFVAGPPAADALDAFLAKYHIVDIRSSADFAKGHIQGAKNVAFENILAEGASAGGKPVLVVCYTGQTACYATSLLRLYGYKDAQALKWGMSGWNETTAGPWNGNTGDIANGHNNWSYDSAPSLSYFADPAISSLSQDGGAILKSRVEAVVQEGFQTVKNSDVLASPEAYFVNNYYSEADYAGFGHIKNAYRILPLSLENGEYQNLDPANGAKVVTYCYTGQTSAVITAYLNVLGYDAYSLTFGMNGLYHSNSQWSSNQWGEDSNPKSLPIVQ